MPILLIPFFIFGCMTNVCWFLTGTRHARGEDGASNIWNALGLFAFLVSVLCAGFFARSVP